MNDQDDALRLMSDAIRDVAAGGVARRYAVFSMEGTPYYAQIYLPEEGIITAECVASGNLPDEAKLGRRQETASARGGWMLAPADGSPNYSRSWPLEGLNATDFAREILEVLAIYGYLEGDELLVEVGTWG